MKTPESKLASNRRWHEKHPEYEKDRAKRRGAARRKIMDDLKSAPCVDCGKVYPPYVMHFDHVPGRGIKLFNIGAWTGGRTVSTMESLLEEIAKCDLVCANCHAIRTWERSH